MTTVNKKHLIRATSGFRSKIAIMRLAARFSRALVLLLYSRALSLFHISVRLCATRFCFVFRLLLFDGSFERVFLFLNKIITFNLLSFFLLI